MIISSTDAFSAILGGLLIGGAASALLLFTGRIAGVSGIVAGLLRPRRGDVGWRVAFIAGLIVGGVLLARVVPDALGPGPSSLSWSIAAGLLVGCGTRLANGCTSGHGVCGLSRRSRRSLAATATFITTGMLTVWVFRHVLGVASR